MNLEFKEAKKPREGTGVGKAEEERRMNDEGERAQNKEETSARSTHAHLLSQLLGSPRQEVWMGPGF